MKRFLPAVSAAAFLALTACGGGSSSSSDNAAAPADSAAPAASSSAMSGSMSSMGGSMNGGTVAAVPAGLKCGAVQPVWVNLNTKVYHEPSDPFYGKTKHGEYLCPSTAKKDGYRPAGGGSESGSMSGHHKKNDSQ